MPDRQPGAGFGVTETPPSCDNGTRMEPTLVIVTLALGVAVIVLRVLLGHARDRVAAAEGRLALSQADAAVAQARLDDLQRVLGDAGQLRQEMSNAAKAAALEAANALSSKLIDDHKRETAEARKETEERGRQASEHLVKQVAEIAKSLAALSGQVDEKGRTLDTVVRSLSSPGGAGQMAEIGLANTLKGFGLEAGRDYALQATTTDAMTGQRLRPDALVFLPDNGVVIIDCKASKFLLAIAEAEGGADEAAAYANLARTMNQHLRALADKNYRGAIETAWREAGRVGALGRVISLMYLPNEAAIEKLGRADPAFFPRAREAEIIPAGPVGLHCVLSLAATEITKERQIENQLRILDAAQTLLESITLALGHAASVGKGIRSAADAFARLTGSVNQRLLPRARRLAALGVPAGKGLPGNLPVYTVMSQEADQLIEGEAAEVPDEPQAAPAPRLVAE
jgi:DNA recombination protein RmuC